MRHSNAATFGSLDGQFVNPPGVCTDAAGNVYVADAGGSRIERFVTPPRDRAGFGRRRPGTLIPRHAPLPGSGPASLELLDVTGRRVRERAVGGLGAGRHAVDLAEGERLAPGLYFVRVTHGADQRVARTVVYE